MTTCSLSFGCFACSPAWVRCLKLNDVDFLVFVGSRQDATLWFLWLNVAAQVVQRQELGINLAGVRKHWIWKWRDVCVTLQGGHSLRLFWSSKGEIQVFVTTGTSERSELKVSYTPLCFWEEFNVQLEETSAGWMFVLTQLFQLKDSVPALFTT